MSDSDTVINAAPVLAEIKFNADGLVPVIAQQFDTGEVLMMAWMNAEAMTETLHSGQVCYWSRSRKTLWRKGETSGQRQALVEFLLDCDGDTVLVKVDQQGVACHTGHRSCFYTAVRRHGLVEVDPVLTNPEDLYPQ